LHWEQCKASHGSDLGTLESIEVLEEDLRLLPRSLCESREEASANSGMLLGEKTHRQLLLATLRGAEG